MWQKRDFFAPLREELAALRTCSTWRIGLKIWTSLQNFARLFFLCENALPILLVPWLWFLELPKVVPFIMGYMALQAVCQKSFPWAVMPAALDGLAERQTWTPAGFLKHKQGGLTFPDGRHLLTMLDELLKQVAGDKQRGCAGAWILDGVNRKGRSSQMMLRGGMQNLIARSACGELNGKRSLRTRILQGGCPAQPWFKGELALNIPFLLHYFQGKEELVDILWHWAKRLGEKGEKQMGRREPVVVRSPLNNKWRVLVKLPEATLGNYI